MAENDDNNSEDENQSSGFFNQGPVDDAQLSIENIQETWNKAFDS